MMGNLRIIKRGLETLSIQENQRDADVKEFCELVAFAHSEKDALCMESGLLSHTFSYGNFYTHFMYASWEQFKMCPSFAGISQKVHQ
jgi:aromatic ring-opening dioxygenase catalytic subunit (LigB family)